jgi:hypothetical protein
VWRSGTSTSTNSSEHQLLMMKLLVCLIVVIGVRARPQGSVVSEVTTVANFEEVNELTTQFGEDDLIEIEKNS